MAFSTLQSRSPSTARSALSFGIPALLNQASSLHSTGATWTWWGHVPPAAKDPILGVTEAYLADTHPQKVNVGVGAYRDDNGKPVVLNCVRLAEERVAGREFMEYSPMGGLAPFNALSLELAYGKESAPVKEKRIASVQSLSGTGACRLFAEFQKRFKPESQIYIPVPTWSNHHSIWRDAGVPEKAYRYYDPKTKGLDFEGLIADVEGAPSGSVFLLHACAHNPTGVDPTSDQWSQISALFKKKGHYALFDMAYQGFASGDPKRDAQAITTFLNDGHQVACAQSYAKNMGLYGQRVGCLSVVCNDPTEAAAVKSQIQMILRPMYSNPPLHGSLLAQTILGDAELDALWRTEVRGMADRIISMRQALRSKLESLGSTLDWSHMTNQIGMFCFSGLTPEQCDKLIKDHHIYLTRNGRISIAGVTSKNVEYIANAIHDVTK